LITISSGPGIVFTAFMIFNATDTAKINLYIILMQKNTFYRTRMYCICSIAC